MFNGLNSCFWAGALGNICCKVSEALSEDGQEKRVLGMCTQYSHPPPTLHACSPSQSSQTNTPLWRQGSARTVWRALRAVVYLPPRQRPRGERVVQRGPWKHLILLMTLWMTVSAISWQFHFIKAIFGKQETEQRQQTQSARLFYHEDLNFISLEILEKIFP